MIPLHTSSRNIWPGCLAILVASLAFACRPSPKPAPVFTPGQDSTSWETIGLLGDTLYPPTVEPDVRHRSDSLLEVALQDFLADSTDLDNIIWLGRRLAYLHRYRDAIRIYSHGLHHHPDSPELLRHRGHRYLTLRRLDDAIRDLRNATVLADVRPVTIEPDGLPNKLDIPLSNLQFNCWYHLGLAYYLTGDNDATENAFAACTRYADNPDLLVAATYWRYLSRLRSGDTTFAKRLLEPIHPDLEIIENDEYLTHLLRFKGENSTPTDTSREAVRLATSAYGLACYEEYQGSKAEAARIRRQLLATGAWPAFGYLAAEADSARRIH